MAFSSLWMDHVYVDGMDLTLNFRYIASAWSPGGIWVTNTAATGSRNVLRGATFYRNYHVVECSGSPFGDGGFTINSHCDRYVLTDFHGDVWHWLVGETDPLSEAADANIIAYNVKAEDFPTQGIFSEVFPNDVIGTPVHCNNVAFVNVTINHIIEDALDYRGGWWEVSTNHLLMHKLKMPTQVMRWNPEQYNTGLSNVSIVDGSFYAFGFSPLPEMTIFHGNSFTNPGLHGAFVPPDFNP